MKIRLTLVTLILASVACMQPVENLTVTPEVTPSSTSQAVRTPTPPPLAPSATPQPVALVMAATVNVRAEPEGEVVGQIYAGQSVTVEGCADGWCEISEPVAGWVFEGCLSVETDRRCEAK